MILDLGVKSKPCWLDEKLQTAMMTSCRVKDEFLYFELEEFKLTYRVPLDHPGMPRHAYAPDGFRVPENGTVLIGKCPEWGYEIYWLVFDPVWFNSLPIKHDGLSRSCPACQEKGF